jgi:hypothetical protein
MTDFLKRRKDDLYEARRTVVNLMLQDIQGLLSGYHTCHSRADYIVWQWNVVADIIDLVDAEPEDYYGRRRGYCPLCKQGSSGPYGGGFLLPEGLRRHLDGYGITHRCRVVKAAFDLAEDGLDRRFAADDIDAQRKDLQRRRTEKVFLVNSWEPPKLLEEGWGWLLAHNPQQMASVEQRLPAAEQRICDLGFEIETSGNVVSYRLKQHGYIVLADPREVGRIVFYIYTEGEKKHRAWPPRFYLLDAWKNDLPGKFKQRLASAIASLDPSRPARALLPAHEALSPSA